jgi:predicted PolB exonuclease-like 3'-5' exonuclease
VELSTVIFNAYRERYYKLAGIVLGDDQSEGVNDFKQKLSQEELHCASQQTPFGMCARELLPQELLLRATAWTNYSSIFVQSS